MRLFSNKKRPVHLGPYPLERLSRESDPTTPVKFGSSPLKHIAENRTEGPFSAGHAFTQYAEIYDQQRHGEVAPAAPVPHDPNERSDNVKAGLYFLDADMVCCGVLSPDLWVGDAIDEHDFAIAILIAHSRTARGRQPGDAWIDGTRQQNADLRAAELAVITAAYIRNLGFSAVAHTPTASEVAIDRVAVQSGLVEVRSGIVRAPFLKTGFALSAVSTAMELAPDGPIATQGWMSSISERRSPAWYLGWGGTRAGIRRLNGDHRALANGRYPMERIKRVSEPTTLIIEDEVRRVPVRGGGFPRAANGDMGPKFQEEVKMFAYKTPQAQAYIDQIAAMVPFQDGPVADPSIHSAHDDSAHDDSAHDDSAHDDSAHDDSAHTENADAVKALAHHLGGDMVGVCAVPTYAWYSHRGDGTEIDPYHKNAIVILLDQGYETMEGASGDDWVSGAQSMRAYMRGAQIAGVLACHIRSLGYSARSQTNRDSDVLHIPLVLQAGLGEMSRIGELVLNPFVGPRFKSVVVTTDLPLKPDRPIDFGLQDFCTKCTKCARECPCAAIPFGDKVMFNGYETWKPDVEKCTKYRIGNQRGAACGRCMKTCPFNIEGVLAERLFLWAAIKLPFTRRWIATLDDRVGNGSINPIKKWWWDLEWKHGRSITPEKGTNARDLKLDGGRVAATQKVALYTPDLLPPGDAIGVPVKLIRKEALAKADNVESPEQARDRRSTTDSND